MQENKEISKSTLQRLPIYLQHLKSLRKSGIVMVSATTMAASLKMGDVQVRKDLASISNAGRPKVGYAVEELINQLENFLTCNNTTNAVLIGAGKLGNAIMDYNGFEEFGLNVVAGFDVNEEKQGISDSGKPIYNLTELGEYVKRMQIRIGIITVPAEGAQDACNLMVNSGIVAILNFASVHLTAPEGVKIQNVNIAASLAVLANNLQKM